MKLLTKTTLYYLFMTIILFCIGGVLFYFSLRKIIDENITENLLQTKEKVIDYVKKTGELPNESMVGRDILIFAPSTKEVHEEVKDTILYNSYEEENLPFRELIFSVKTGQGYYITTAGTPLLESDDLIQSIVSSLGLVAGILLIVLFLLNWFLSKSIWKPFYKTLDYLKSFDLSKKDAISFSAPNTYEFKMLNEELGKMTKKMRIDYQNLKEFTENASHEIQTPLAVIRSKLELMIQSENLQSDQMKMIQDAYESTNRLSKLNQSLLLLSKIENGQFHEVQSLNLNSFVDKKLSQFEELISLKGIKIQKQMDSVVGVKMNLQLADILLSNILSNAIRHNINEGRILVEIKDNSLTVSNPGTPMSFSAERLFERFKKDSASSESVGLGLSIVKQICDTYNFNLNYSFTNGLHTISISF